MTSLKFLSKSRISTQQIITDTRTYLTRIYGQANQLFSLSSPYGQILTVLSEITNLIFFYIEDATVEQNILTAQHPESIYGLARLAGHDAFRGSSATGELKIRLNTSAFNEIDGDALIIPANSIIKAAKNGLEYILKTNSDQFVIQKSNPNYIYIPVVQGKIESQTLTGTGEKLQSFNIITKKNTDHYVFFRFL